MFYVKFCDIKVLFCEQKIKLALHILLRFAS